MAAENEIEGWQEAVLAWEICASSHREFAKGKPDPFWSTRQKDFKKHQANAQEKLNQLLNAQTIKNTQK